MQKRYPGFLSVIALAFVAFGLTPTMQAQPAAQANTENAMQSAAMDPSASAPAKTYNQLLGMVEHELVPLVEAMPADKFNFAPTQGNFNGVRTFAEQVKHLTGANYLFFSDISSVKPANKPQMSDLKTKDQMVQALKDSFGFAHQAINTMTAQNAFESVKPVDGISTRAGVVSFAIIHMNDHFGQLVEYLRMNGVVPPSSQRPRK